MTSRRILSHVAVAALSMAGAVGATVLLMKPQSRTAAPAPGAPSPHASPEARGDGGPAGVYISPARQQLIGVRTAAVTTRTLDAAIRATGTVTFDETRVAEVHTRVAGWVDRTDVDFVGKPVTRGAPRFSVYSPDLVSAQR